MHFLDIAVVVGIAAITAAYSLAWISRPNTAPKTTVTPEVKGAAFLFDGGRLHHASDATQKIFALNPGIHDWHSLRQRFASRFPNLPEHPGKVQENNSEFRSVEPGDTAKIRLSKRGTFTHVQIDDNAEFATSLDSEISEKSCELNSLQRASDTTPHPIWQTASAGEVVWHNLAYAMIYNKLHGFSPRSDTPLFDGLDQKLDKTGHRRVSAQVSDDSRKDWYDISSFEVNNHRIFHAINVNAVVDSEVAQRNFVQTLAKTFAQLSIGLAIFDRNGQLVLFNPALIDLTNLPADFLSARPTLMSFFDRLRENRRMPEPKNYRSWRQEIAEVISAATDGRYQETWTLETGQTYRVRGRPHPDGAIAFLIEDISAEISLTRNFRAELELGQSLMDTFEDGLVVFSSTGVLTFCNNAYRSMWRLDPGNSFADVTVGDSIKEWKTLCQPSDEWDALADFVLDYQHRDPCDFTAKMQSGETINCFVSPIVSGATLVRFSPEKTLSSEETRQTIRHKLG